MAKQHQFSSHKRYVRAQLAITRRKLKQQERGKPLRSFCVPPVVAAIADKCKALGLRVTEGLCHGVRLGVEVDLLEEATGGRWRGTEITPELCDGKRILHRDFSEPDPEWFGAIDAIYTNSLDHARYPYKTVKAWLACLSPEGRLFVEWTEWHDKLGNAGRNNLADCYAASREEYRELFKQAGRLDEVITLEYPPKTTRVIFVVY